MKRILSVLLAILVCCSCFVSVIGVSAATTDMSKKLSVSSNTEGARYLVDGNGNPVRLFGMARLQSAAQEGRNEENADAGVMARRYKSLGLNYMRLAINIKDIEGETIADSLSIKSNEDIDAWIDEFVAPDVEAIIAEGMYVSLDMHEYAPWTEGYTEAQTADYCRNNYLPVLRRLAARYKDEPMVANIEVWNEPNFGEGSTAPGNTTWRAELREYYIDAVTAIRAEGFDGVIIISDTNAGWQNYTHYDWEGYYDDLYVGGNRNIAFSQHVSGKQLDPASTDKEGNPNFTEEYVDDVNAYVMEENICVIFNEVEDECGETNTTAGMEAFVQWMEDTKEDFNYSACLWRPRTDYMNRTWVWGTNGWAASYTGGTLVRTYANWFKPDGVTVAQGWKVNQGGSGDSICFPAGDGQVGTTAEYAYTANVKTAEKGPIEFTKNWHYEKDAASRLGTDLTGYNYVIIEISFPDEARANYALGIADSGRPFIYLDNSDAVATYADFRTVMGVYANELKAGKWVKVALPLSETIYGPQMVVSMDNNATWNSPTSQMNIKYVNFATAEYVAENYADFTPEGALAVQAERKVPKSANFFKGAPVNGGDGSNWVQNEYGHSASNAWGLDMGNAEDGYYIAASFNSKELPIRSGYDDKPAVDTTDMAYIKFRIKFDKPEKLDAALDMINGAGWIKDYETGTVIADINALKAKLVELKDYIKAGKYVDIAIPLTTEIDSIKRLSIKFTDQWDGANALGIKYYIESIDFVNYAYVEENNLLSPVKSLQVYNPANHGVDGCTVVGKDLPVNVQSDYTALAWCDRNAEFTKNWHPYDVNGYDYLAIKFKFDSAASAEFALNNLTSNNTGVFATVHGGTLGWTGNAVGTIATATYNDFKAAINEKAYELLKCEDFVTIYVPFEEAIVLSDNLKTVKVTTNFGIKWSDPAVWLHIASVDLVTANYAKYNAEAPATMENEIIKIADDAATALTHNEWYPQMDISTKEGVLVNSTASSVTLMIKSADIETILANTTFSSRGSETGDWTDGNGFKIYFGGTGVNKVGVNYDNFMAAFTSEIIAKLAAGETVPVTFKLTGTLESGKVTNILVMPSHGGKAANVVGCEFAISSGYFNYNAETYFDKFDAADFDLDGNVASTDLIMVKKYLFDTAVKFENLSAGDANLDGNIDILDAIAVANKALVG